MENYDFMSVWAEVPVYGSDSIVKAKDGYGWLVLFGLLLLTVIAIIIYMNSQKEEVISY